MKFLEVREEAMTLPATGGLPASSHVFDKNSIVAINAALATRRPLLVRGEPGTGKSQLARADCGENWLRFGKQLLESGRKFRALVPCPPFQWERELAELWNAIEWENPLPTVGIVRKPEASVLEEQRSQLLKLVAPALRVEPGLLRELRQLLGRRADAGTEASVWALFPNPSAVAATPPREVAEWRRRLAEEGVGLELERQAVAILQRWHEVLPPLVLAEEVVSHAPVRAVEESKIIELRKYLLAACEAIRVRGRDGASAEISWFEAWSKRLANRPADQELFGAMAEAWQSVCGGHSDPPLNPDLASLAVGKRNDFRRRYAIIQRGAQLLLAPFEDKERIAGSLVGAVRTTDNRLLISEPVGGSSWVEVGDTEAVIEMRSLPPLLQIASNLETVLIERSFRPAVAMAAGCDGYGLWIELKTIGLLQRYRYLSMSQFEARVLVDAVREELGWTRRTLERLKKYWGGQQPNVSKTRPRHLLQNVWVRADLIEDGSFERSELEPRSEIDASRLSGLDLVPRIRVFEFLRQSTTPTKPLLPHPLSAGIAPAWAAEWGEDRYGVFAVLRVGKVSQKLRYIPPGSFWMGSPESEEGRWEAEGPQHLVTLTEGYWLADTPCTQELWQELMGKNPSEFKSPRRPVEQVSWDEVQSFLRRLEEREPELEARLPTEAQWEYACRAGTTTSTYAGELKTLGANNGPLLDDIAWYGGNSGVHFELEDGWDSSKWLEMQYPNKKSGSRAVATKLPNPWGLFDMLGNVWECCADYWSDRYKSGDQVNPIGPSMGLYRVFRGGPWYGSARYVRAAYRYGHGPGFRDNALGFRFSLGEPRSEEAGRGAR